jgi:radical SAM superfamily enzyme YgiQ (UPF0313 family)
MKVLILNPISRVTKNVVRDVLYGCWCDGKRIGGGTVPPFALVEVATILRNDGTDTVFLDAQAEQKTFEEIMKVVSEVDAVVTSTSTMTFIEDANLLLEMKQKHPGLKTVVFGSHPTFMPHYTLAHEGVDIAARYEPEYILRDLFRKMRSGEEWRDVMGIVYRKNGDIIVNPEYPFIDNLDELPFPDVTLLPQGIDYFNPIVRRLPYMATATSKGCPGQCTFCTAPAFDGHKVRFQSSGYVVGEIEYFLGHGFREVYFRDDTFFVNKKRDSEICNAIIDRKLDVSWIANARINMIDRETMAMARQAGCHTLKLGVESGVQEILDKVKKGYRLEQAREVFRWAREVGINTHAHCMLGMPGDSVQTVQRTIDFVKELSPTTATFGICTPYPGTPLFDEVAKIYPEIRDGTASDLSKLHIKGLFNEHYTHMSRKELDRCVQRAYRSFYVRPSYMLNFLRQIRSMDDVKRISIAAMNILDFSFFGD